MHQSCMYPMHKVHPVLRQLEVVLSITSFLLSFFLLFWVRESLHVGPARMPQVPVLPLLGEAKRRLGGAPGLRPWPLGTQGSSSGNAGL